MRYPAEHKQQTHDRIVRAAARRFRSRGRDGAVIGDLMRDLPLTHGGFYHHFASTDDLYVEAFEQALADARARIEHAIKQGAPGQEPQRHCRWVSQPRALRRPRGPMSTGGARHRDSAAARKSRERMLQALRNHVTRLMPYVPGAEPGATAQYHRDALGNSGSVDDGTGVFEQGGPPADS